MIVVVGLPQYRDTVAGTPTADGLASRVALAAAARGPSVQLVGKTGEDKEGDTLLLALSRGGVGHVAVLRDAGMATARSAERTDPYVAADAAATDAAATTDAAADRTSGPIDRTPAEADSVGLALDATDIDLGLRYLTEFTVLVLADSTDAEIVRVVTAAADWADARLIVVVPAGEPVPDGLPPDAIVFEAPDEDPDGVFAEMVGAFAAALDDGDDPAVAFRSTVEAEGWTKAPVD